VLGLEVWNEDVRMKNTAGQGTTKEMGFETSTGNAGFGFRNDEPKGFVNGKFEMYPWARFPEPSFAQACLGVEWTLFWGARLWDQMNLRGLVPSETASISWLQAGEPRRLFFAGGSDAHGDLNYHRAGYMLGLEQIDDTAIGKPRNLVFAGAPEVVVAGSRPGALAAGRGPGPGGPVLGTHVPARSPAPGVD